MKPKCHAIAAYLEKLIVPIIGREYLVKPKIVSFDVRNLHRLAKVLFLLRLLFLYANLTLNESDIYFGHIFFATELRRKNYKFCYFFVDTPFLLWLIPQNEKITLA